MAEPNDDVSMILLRAGGSEVVSKSIALSLAEMIFRHVFGDDDFKTQIPLNITDGGDRWIVEGSRRAEDHFLPDGQPALGNTQIEILKVNCRIVKLSEKQVFQ